MSLLNEEAKHIPAIKIKVQEALEAGRDIPDEILLRAVDKRLKQSDCRVNGWVLDGFPQNESQVYLLNSMGIKPSLVCIFEQPAEESVSRLKDRSMDPSTGASYNSAQVNKLAEVVKKRLVKQKSDSEGAVRSRY
jgi:adenylate kinase